MSFFYSSFLFFIPLVSIFSLFSSSLHLQSLLLSVPYPLASFLTYIPTLHTLPHYLFACPFMFAYSSYQCFHFLYSFFPSIPYPSNFLSFVPSPYLISSQLAPSFFSSLFHFLLSIVLSCHSTHHEPASSNFLHSCFSFLYSLFPSLHPLFLLVLCYSRQSLHSSPSSRVQISVEHTDRQAVDSSRLEESTLTIIPTVTTPTNTYKMPEVRHGWFETAR